MELQQDGLRLGMLSDRLASLMQVFRCPSDLARELPGQLNVVGTGEEEENQEPTPTLGILLLYCCE